MLFVLFEDLLLSLEIFCSLWRYLLQISFVVLLHGICEFLSFHKEIISLPTVLPGPLGTNSERSHRGPQSDDVRMMFIIAKAFAEWAAS